MAPQGTGTVRNVVFDMGGVLLRWEPEVYARNVTDNDEDAGLVLEALFKGSAWTLSDAGVFGPETVLMEACHALPERLHGAAAEALRRFPSMQAVIPEVNELGRRLKERGYGVYILSNVSSRFRSSASGSAWSRPAACSWTTRRSTAWAPSGPVCTPSTSPATWTPWRPRWPASPEPLRTGPTGKARRPRGGGGPVCEKVRSGPVSRVL